MDNITFVIGAGASCEAGKSSPIRAEKKKQGKRVSIDKDELPAFCAGEDLAKKIANFLDVSYSEFIIQYWISTTFQNPFQFIDVLHSHNWNKNNDKESNFYNAAVAGKLIGDEQLRREKTLFLAVCLYEHVKKYHSNLIDASKIQTLSEHWQQYDKANKAICQKLPFASSIDYFLHEQNDEDISLCAKIAITYLILAAERNSWLTHWDRDKREWQNMRPCFRTEAWYYKFFKMLTEGKNVKEFEGQLKKIKLIIFNYDRCVEYFLYIAIIHKYGISDAEAARLVNLIDIFHPYGTIGKLPWQEGAYENNSIDFASHLEQGGDNIIRHATKLYNISQELKTYTETMAGENPITKTYIESSSKVIYLGFSFLNAQNLKFINFQSNIYNRFHYATVYGVAEEEYPEIRHLIYKREATEHITLKNITCSDFFNYYPISLKI